MCPCLFVLRGCAQLSRCSCSPRVDLLEPHVPWQRLGWVRALGPADTTQGCGKAGLRQGHERSLSVLGLYLSGLLLSLSKGPATDCCELTLTLPFTAFSRGELEKGRSAMGEFQGSREGTSLSDGREVSGADPQRNCVIEESRP